MSLTAEDPLLPRAPSREAWERMTEAERRAAVDALPAEVPMALHPPEGDPHSRAKDRAVSALDEFFRRVGQKVYVSKELATYYPNEPLFCPDVLAVRDVETHPREKWVVSDEGKGLDIVLEVHFKGSRAKDFETNVRRYARLGIPEYFVFDRRNLRLSGWRLRGDREGGPNASGVYEPIVPQAGKLTSRVLQLDLCVEEDRVRFYFGTAPLAEAEELVVRLERMVDEVTERAREEAERARVEAERARVEAERANELQGRLTEALAEIERLKSR